VTFNAPKGANKFNGMAQLASYTTPDDTDTASAPARREPAPFNTCPPATDCLHVIIDSGASQSIFPGNFPGLVNLRPCSYEITVANGKTLICKATADLYIDLIRACATTLHACLKNVLITPAALTPHAILPANAFTKALTAATFATFVEHFLRLWSTSSSHAPRSEFHSRGGVQVMVSQAPNIESGRTYLHIFAQDLVS